MAPKSEQLQIRVSAAQKSRLRALAARAGQDVSAYVIARALPEARAQFDRAVRRLRDESARTYAFAEIADLLRNSASELDLDAPPEGLGQLSAVDRNYLAALVEQSRVQRGESPPDWTRAIEPLDSPWFATTLKSLRTHLLLVSPVAFKRRNLFVDPGEGRV